MSDSETYTPISTKPENDFRLIKSSRGAEKAIRKVEVRYAGMDLEQRKHLCDIEKWTYEEHIPELSDEPRIELSALQAMLKRTDEDDSADLRDQLNQLVLDWGVNHEAVESISADEYWMGLAEILFKEFPNNINPDNLDFKEIQRAYQDFF